MASTVSGAAPVIVRFDDQSAGTITARLWTFGDGDISTDTSPTHRYTANGLYTVTLTVWGPDGRDTRVKEHLIAVGSLAELEADNQDPEFVDQPAFWLTLAVSPPVAFFLALRDHLDHDRRAITDTTDEGRALVKLIEARNASTTPGAVDQALEAFLDGTTRIRHRLDGNALEHLDQSSSIARDLRDLLVAELALRTADPNDPRLADLGQRILDRVDEFNAAIDQLAGSSG